MEFLSEEESSELYGEPVALKEFEIKNIIRLARPTKNDIFYDLGSGYGEIVRYIFKNTKVKKAIGIESDPKRFLIAIEKTRDEFYKKDLKNIDFWCVDYGDYDISDATIIYDGIDEISDFASLDNEPIKLYNKYFEKKKIRILKRDLPLIGYGPAKSLRDKKGSWFFLMKTPLDDYKIDRKEEWIESVFGKKDKTVSDIIRHYLAQYEKRDIKSSRIETSSLRRNVERIMKKRFSSRFRS